MTAALLRKLADLPDTAAPTRRADVASTMDDHIGRLEGLAASLIHMSTPKDADIPADVIMTIASCMADHVQGLDDNLPAVYAMERGGASPADAPRGLEVSA